MRSEGCLPLSGSEYALPPAGKSPMISRLGTKGHMTTTWNDYRIAGVLLLTGGIAFIIGAFSPPWEQWYSPLKRSLQVIGEHRTAWIWIHIWFVIGVVLTILGTVAYAFARAKTGTGALLPALVATSFTIGAVLWLASIAFRLTVQVWAAGEVLTGDTIPAGYEAQHRFSGVLFAMYMALAYLACAGLGWDVLRTGLVARWAGWFSIAFGLSAGAVVGRNIPFFVHIPFMIVGVLLLRR